MNPWGNHLVNVLQHAGNARAFWLRPIDPRSAGAHHGLGVALARSGRVRDALVESPEALAHFQAAVGTRPEARQHLERTLRLLGR